MTNNFPLPIYPVAQAGRLEWLFTGTKWWFRYLGCFFSIALQAAKTGLSRRLRLPESIQSKERRVARSPQACFYDASVQAVYVPPARNLNSRDLGHGHTSAWPKNINWMCAQQEGMSWVKSYLYSPKQLIPETRERRSRKVFEMCLLMAHWAPC